MPLGRLQLSLQPCDCLRADWLLKDKTIARAVLVVQADPAGWILPRCGRDVSLPLPPFGVVTGYSTALLQGPRGRRFLISEVPLYRVGLLALPPPARLTILKLTAWVCGTNPMKGYLAHEKTPTPLRPPPDPRHMPTVGS